MKILLTLLSVGSLWAAPIAFDCSGACTSLGQPWQNPAWMLDLAPDRAAVITSSIPLQTLSIYLYDPIGGAGMAFTIDAAHFLDVVTPADWTIVLYDFVTGIHSVGITSPGEQRTLLVLQGWNALQETVREDRGGSSVPEPATWIQGAIGLGLTLIMRRKR